MNTAGVKIDTPQKAKAMNENNDALYQKARNACVRRHQLIFPFAWDTGNNVQIQSAFNVLQSLADTNYGKAYYLLARLYSRAKGIEERQARAKHYAHIAFNWSSSNKYQNDVEVWFDLGEMYSQGIGTEKDGELALMWFTKAANNGYPVAQMRLGHWFSYKDDEVSVKWFRMAADQGVHTAQAQLGMQYREGRGVPHNEEEAVKWFLLAAKQGNADAQNSLGVSYLEGLGVCKNYEEAEKWIRLAADQGDSFAKDNLDLIYRLKDQHQR